MLVYATVDMQLAVSYRIFDIPSCSLMATRYKRDNDEIPVLCFSFFWKGDGMFQRVDPPRMDPPMMGSVALIMRHNDGAGDWRVDVIHVNVIECDVQPCPTTYGTFTGDSQGLVIFGDGGDFLFEFWSLITILLIK